MTTPAREHPIPIHPRPEPERLREALERRVSALAQAARRVREGAAEEAIHDLRVAVRRAAAALRVWKDPDAGRAARDATRGLRRLRRRLGAARELEVHVALLDAHLVATGDRSDTPAVLAAVSGRLAERLARRRRAAMRRVSPRRLRRLLRVVGAATEGLDLRVRERPRATERALAAERRLAERATAAVRRAASRPDDDSLHGARVRVKKWRYAVECLAEAMPGRSWPEVAPLRRIQSALGDVHDRTLLLRELVRHAFDPPPGPERERVHALIDSLDAERDAALRTFQGLAADLAPADRPGGPAEPASEAPAASRPGDDAPPSRARDTDVTAGPHPDARWERIATWLERSRRR